MPSEFLDVAKYHLGKVKLERVGQRSLPTPVCDLQGGPWGIAGLLGMYHIMIQIISPIFLCSKIISTGLSLRARRKRLSLALIGNVQQCNLQLQSWQKCDSLTIKSDLWLRRKDINFGQITILVKQTRKS